MCTPPAPFVQQARGDFTEVSPLALADAALEAFWPGCGLTPLSEGGATPEAQHARRLLTSREWVPAVDTPLHAPQAGGSGADSGGGAAAAIGRQQADTAEAGDSAEADEVAPVTLCAQALADVLAHLAEQQGGDVARATLADVRRWALLLWLDLATPLVMRGEPQVKPLGVSFTAFRCELIFPGRKVDGLCGWARGRC